MARNSILLARQPWVPIGYRIQELFCILPRTLIFLFAVQLGWLPASGYVAPWDDWRRNLMTILLPSVVLGTGVAGVMMRHARSAHASEPLSGRISHGNE